VLHVVVRKEAYITDKAVTTTVVFIVQFQQYCCVKVTGYRGVTTTPADPAMQGGPRTQGAQARCPKIFSSL